MEASTSVASRTSFQSPHVYAKETHGDERDIAGVPARWLRTDSRASLLTGTPSAATSPINAMRNCLFASLQSEARVALLAHGA
jgi:hypothetical protein